LALSLHKEGQTQQKNQENPTFVTHLEIESLIS